MFAQNKNQNGLVTMLLLIILVLGAILWLVFNRVVNSNG
jgi:hypothetical protein